MLTFFAGLFVGLAMVGVIMGLHAVWRDLQYQKDMKRIIKILNRAY